MAERAGTKKKRPKNVFRVFFGRFSTAAEILFHPPPGPLYSRGCDDREEILPSPFTRSVKHKRVAAVITLRQSAWLNFRLNFFFFFQNQWGEKNEWRLNILFHLWRWSTRKMAVKWYDECVGSAGAAQHGRINVAVKLYDEGRSSKLRRLNVISLYVTRTTSAFGPWYMYIYTFLIVSSHALHQDDWHCRPVHLIGGLTVILLFPLSGFHIVAVGRDDIIYKESYFVQHRRVEAR